MGCSKNSAPRFSSSAVRKPARTIKGDEYGMLYKPNSVTHKELDAIHLGLRLPAASCDLPGNRRRAASWNRSSAFPYLVLLLMGFTKPCISRFTLVRSYRTVSPLPVPKDLGGLLSVALSVGLPRLAVNQHDALRSSDFPPPRLRKTAAPRRSRIQCHSILSSQKEEPPDSPPAHVLQDHRRRQALPRVE